MSIGDLLCLLYVDSSRMVRAKSGDVIRRLDADSHFYPTNIRGRNGERFSGVHRADLHVESAFVNPIRD